MEAEAAKCNRADETLESQNRLLNALLDNLQVGVFLVEAPTGKPILANRHATDLLGRGILNGAGKNTLAQTYKAFRFGTNDYYPQDQMPIVRGMYGESHYVDDMVVEKPDGTRVLLEVFGSSVTDKQGNVVASLVSFSDISERKQFEKKLQQTLAMLETAIKQSPSGVIIADAPDVRIRFANAAAFAIRGETQQQLTEIDVAEHAIRWQTFYPDGSPYVPEDLPLSKAVLKGQISKNVEVIIRHESGKEHWVSANAAPIRDPNGTVRAGIVVFHDITDRVQAEAALRESEEKFRTLVEQSPLGISLIGKNGHYSYTNPQFRDMFGYSLEDIPTGTEWFKKAYPDKGYRQKVISAWITDQKQTKIGQARPRVFSVKCKNGSRKEIHFRSVTLKNLDQFVIYEDITEKAKLERELQQAQKFEAIGTLAGGMAHDFNNLLMGIQGRSSLMAVDLESTHPHFEHLTAIEKYIRSATDLTKQLLGFARGGKYEAKLIDINELMLSSSGMFGRTKKEIQIHIKTHEPSPVVKADQRQLELVFLNLYVNAWQAMPDGGELYIETKIVTLDNEYCKLYQAKPGRYGKVSVTDTGIGMDGVTRQQIFDPFFTTKEKGRGTGLGLASAYGVIKNHGGMITAYSEIGHGTTFNIYLPLSGGEVHREATMEEKLTKGTETILLVDDEEMIIDVGQAMLKKLGYRVLIAKGGQQAVNAVIDMGDKIDLIILDLIMPKMDGGKAFDRIREIQPGMPVMLASGYSINGQAQEIVRRGCSGFIQKPFHISELSQKVRQILDAANR